MSMSDDIGGGPKQPNSVWRSIGTRLLAAALALSTVGTMTAIGGCESYRPLPLPAHARLEHRIEDLVHTVPAPMPGAEPTVINVSEPLTVDEIGLLAILNDPDLRTERGEYDLAKAELEQSKVLPNPSVTLGYAALLGGPGTTGALTASLTQDVKPLLTYRGRVASARAHVSQVNAELLWREWQVAQKARLLAVDLYWAGVSIGDSEAALATAARMASRVGEEVESGNMSQATLAPLLASKADLEHSVSSLRADQLKNWQQLDALLGLTPDARFAIARPQIPAVPADLDAQIDALADRRPDLIALRLGYRSADEHVRAAILGQFPALMLGGSWNSDTSDVRSGGPTVTFDLPIFDRNQGEIAKTRATRRLLYEQYQSRLDEVESTIEGLRARSEQVSAALANAREDAASAHSQADVARRAYDEGTLDQRALSEYETAALQRRLTLYDLERGLAQVRIGLAFELGAGLPRIRLAPLDSDQR